jgi:hypothetical protein
VLATPHCVHPDRLEIKLRLGHAAPSGFSLHALGVRDFDAAYGGRWNAGSSRRGGGTKLPLDAFVARLETRVSEYLELLRKSLIRAAE